VVEVEVEVDGRGRVVAAITMIAAARAQTNTRTQHLHTTRSHLVGADEARGVALPASGSAIGASRVVPL
jgi:hypothetical protein